MSSPADDGQPSEGRPKRSLKEELASLRIERTPLSRRESPPPRPAAPAPEPWHPARAKKGRRPRASGFAIWLIPVVVLGGLGIFAYRQFSPQLQARPEVAVALVQTMTSAEAETLLTAKGYLKSHNQALVGAKVPGRVERLLIEEGKTVKRGDLLAVLEHADLDATLESRQATVQRTQAELNEARADRVDKDRKAQRARRLYAQRVASIEDVEQAQTGLDMVSARVAALEAGVAFARAQVIEAQRAVDNMMIVAPFSGTVLRKEAEAGETVSTMSMGGSNTRSAIANLADLEHMEVETDVSENLLARLAIGQPAEVQVGAVPEARYRGRVQRIIPMGDRTRGTVKVMVEILEPDGRLFPELAATVHFLPLTATQEPPAVAGPSLFVPKEAVVDEGGATYAWIVDPNQALRKRRIVVAQAPGDLARVASGLEGGETVVLKPATDLRDGVTVRVAQ